MRLPRLVVVIVAAAAVTLAAFTWIVRHDQRLLTTRTATERQGIADELAEEMEDRLTAASSDLQVLGALVERGADEPSEGFAAEFDAVLTASDRYQAALGRTHEGTRRVAWTSARLPEASRRRLADFLERESTRASDEGTLRASEALSGDGHRYRALAVRRGATAMLVAVDEDDLLRDALAYGRRAGDTRVELRDPEPASATGLVDDTIRSTASVRLGGSERWRLVLVSSLDGVARERRNVTLRGAAVTGGMLVLVLVLGGFMLRQERREAALTERLRLQDELIRAEKLATVGVLSAGIAHEVGTPLAIVRATAERELKRASDPERRAALDSIVEEIDRVSRIFRGLLDFSRRKTAMHREPVALAPIAQATVELVAPVSQRSGVEIDVSIEAGLPDLLADADHLRQVLLNLLVNACDACRASGPSGRVTLSANALDDQVEIRIRDTGPGIRAEHLHRVFDPFFTTKKRGEGTGLGLSVVADLVKAHEARIDIDTGPGAGTVVRLAWPTASRGEGAAR